MALTASPEKVLEVLSEPYTVDQNQERVIDYLRQYIGDMKAEEIRRFLRFVTGSSVCTSRAISLSFNALSGFDRRPIGHICSSLLELPSTYSTYEEFATEFRSILYGEENVNWPVTGI